MAKKSSGRPGAPKARSSGVQTHRFPTNGAVEGQAVNKATTGPQTLPPLAPPATPTAPTRNEEERRAARLARQTEARAQAAKRRRMSTLRTAGFILAGVLVVGGLIAAWAINEASKPGEHIAMQPSPHIATATTQHAPYTTDPPTSGPHVPTVPSWGIHTEALVKEEQVHALEDAGVVINYQPEIDKATLEKLQALIGTYPTQVVLSPYPGLDKPIVLTAWTRIQRFSAYDEAALRRFIDAYRGIDHHGESGS